MPTSLTSFANYQKKLDLLTQAQSQQSAGGLPITTGSPDVVTGETFLTGPTANLPALPSMSTFPGWTGIDPNLVAQIRGLVPVGTQDLNQISPMVWMQIKSL